MRAGSLSLGVAYLLLCALPAQAADLAKIERTIAKEPKYEWKPKYGLLVFGPEAKFHVWLVLDGSTLYVDRNGNGDLTEPDKRVTPQDTRWVSFRTALSIPDDKTPFLLRLSRDGDVFELSVRIALQRWQLVGFDGPGPNCASPIGPRTRPSSTSSAL